MRLLYLIRDLAVYPFTKDKTENKFHHLLVFLFKDYPAFLRAKPSIRRILLRPFLLLQKIFQTQE